MKQEDRRPHSRGQAVGGAFGRIYGEADAAKHPEGSEITNVLFLDRKMSWERETERGAICAL